MRVPTTLASAGELAPRAPLAVPAAVVPLEQTGDRQTNALQQATRAAVAQVAASPVTTFRDVALDGSNAVELAHGLGQRPRVRFANHNAAARVWRVQQADALDALTVKVKADAAVTVDVEVYT